MKRAREIGIHDAVECRAIDIAPIAVAHIDAGAVDENVAAPALLGDLPSNRIDLLALAHIRRGDDRLAAFVANHRGGLVERLAPAAGQDDLGAGSGEPQRACLPDTRSATCHPRDFAVDRTLHGELAKPPDRARTYRRRSRYSRRPLP